MASFFVSRVDTEADRRLDEIGGQATRLQGKLAIANAKLAYQHWQETFAGPALGVPRRQGRDDAALPLGVDLDEEPRVPRRDVRRGADRAGDGEHDAARDGRGLPGSRQGRGRHAHRGRRRGAAAARASSRRSASTTTTSSRRSRRRACRSSPTRSRSCWTGSAPSAASSQRRSSVSPIVERIWGYDASLWTDSGEDRWLGWLDVVTRVRPHVDELNAFAEAATEQFHDCVLLGMGGSSLAPEVLRRTFKVESFHVLDTTHPEAIRRLERSIDLEQTLFIVSSKSGSTIETRSHLEYFWRQTGGRGAQFAAITDPGLGARAARERARLPGHLRRRAGDRRPLLGALDVRDRAGRSDGGRRRALPAGGGRDDRSPAMSEDGNPGLELGLRLGEGWKQGRDKVCVDETPTRLRPLGRAADRRVDRQAGKGLVPAPGEPPDGPDRQPRRGRDRRSLRPGAASSTAGSSRPRSRATSSGSTRSTSPTCRRRRTRRARCSRRGEPDLSQLAAARSTSCSARRGEGDYVCIQAFIDPAARGGAASRLLARARETGCVVTNGLGPRYLHSTGQLHKGGPEHRPLRPGRGRHRRRAGDPGPRLRLRPPDPLAGGGRLRGARGAGQACNQDQTGGPLMQLGMVGLGRMGRE